MKVLVTGGAGFIGSNFIRGHLKKYPRDQVINLDKITYAGHLSSTRDFEDNPRYKFVRGDITNSRLVGELMKGVDRVVHFAAESHVDRSIDHPGVFVKTNVTGTLVLLNAAVKNRVKRFHHVSTDEVFGSLKADLKTKFDEETPYDPHSPYAASKAGSDFLVRAYGTTFGLPFTISNCSNNFGPYQDPEKFLPRMIINLIESRKAPVYGDGLYVRDWLYVEDHCRAIELIIREGKVGQTYCVGGQKNREYNNLEIINLVLEFLNLDESRIEFVKDRPGHDRRYAVDWRKINKELGWEPKHDFKTWLFKTVRWYQENEWWWKPLKRRAENFYKLANHK